MGLNERDLELIGSSRTMSIAKQSSERTFQTPPSMVTSAQLTLHDLNLLTSSQADSHVRTSRKRTRKAKASKANDRDCGHITQKLLGRYDPSTRSLKMYQTSLIKDSILSLETLPKQGMMRNGFVYELLTSERCTRENDCSLLPTPVRADAERQSNHYCGGNPTLRGALLPTLTINGNYNYKGASKTSGNGIITVLKGALLPTILRTEYKGSQKNRYKGSTDFHGAKMSEGLRICKEDPIYLNPYFAEVVMGFPSGWTELNAVEMQSFRKSRNSSHGE